MILNTDNSKRIAEFVQAHFVQNNSHRISTGIDDRFEEGRRIRHEEPTRDDIAEFGELAWQFNIAGTKCDDWDAIAQDIQFNIEDKPWNLTPTPEPNLPEYMKTRAAESVVFLIQSISQRTGIDFTTIFQQKRIPFMHMVKELAINKMAESSARATKLMERRIYDNCVDADFLAQYKMMISDMGYRPNAFMRGPFVDQKMMSGWEDTGLDFRVRNSLTKLMKVERVNGLYVYPSPDSTNTQDGKCIIIADRITLSSLLEMRNLESTNTSAIDDIIHNMTNEQGNVWWQSSKYSDVAAFSTAQTGDTTSVDSYSVPFLFGNQDVNFALTYYGRVTGHELKSLKVNQIKGASGTHDVDKGKVYEVEFVVVGDKTIKAVNRDLPYPSRPIHTTSYQNLPGSFWGRSITDILKYFTKVCNWNFRMLKINSKWAGEPSLSLRRDMISPDDPILTGEDDFFPGIQLLSTPSMRTGGNQRPVEFITAPDRMASFRESLLVFYRIAGDIVGLQAQLTGVAASAAANRTASVYFAASDNATRKVKKTLSGIDINILKPMIEQFYNIEMIIGTDMSVKADAQVITKGAMGLINKEAFNQQIPAMMNQARLGVAEQRYDPSILDAIDVKFFDSLGFDVRQYLNESPDERALLSLPEVQGLIPAGGQAAAGNLSGQLDQRSITQEQITQPPEGI